MYPVRFKLTHVPPVNAAELASTLPITGALFHVRVVSPQLLSATDAALIPKEPELLAKIFNVTDVTVPLKPDTLNLM